MKIAHLIDSLTVGGAQTLILTFAKVLKEINAVSPDKHQLTVINFGYATIKESIEAQGAFVYTLESDQLISPKEDIALLRILQREKFDVIQSHLARSNILAATMGFLTGTPSICTLHSTRENPRFYNPYRNRAETWALRFFADKVIAVGDSVAQAHQNRLRAKPIDILPNPVNPIPDISVSERIRLRTGIMGDPHRPLIISVGRLRPPKGYQDLINAFAIVHQKYPGAFLAIAGEGFLYEELKNQIQQNGLRDHAVLLGNRDDVSQLLKAADIFVNSSHWEGLPLAILEAMAAGLPVVATDVGDVAQIVSADRGLIVPPQRPDAIAEALISFLENTDQCKAFGKAGLAYVTQEHNPLVWTRQLLSIYEKLR